MNRSKLLAENLEHQPLAPPRLPALRVADEAAIIVALQRLWPLFVFLILSCRIVSAQEAEFLPEVDVYLKLTSTVRLWGQASNTREGGDPTQASVGPSLEIYMKPLIELKEVAAFDLDDAKSRPLVFTAGYRYLATPGSPSTNRMELTATFHFPVKPGSLLVSDRNRSDLDWSDGTFKWRYRNKLEIEKSLVIRSYHPSPYSSVEVYYESQYQKWSTTEVYLGCLFPIRRHFELDSYYEHQNNTGKSPNRQLHGVGLTFNIFLSAK
jgi:Protein of unknown function (DUF2490)